MTKKQEMVIAGTVKVKPTTFDVNGGVFDFALPPGCQAVILSGNRGGGHRPFQFLLNHQVYKSNLERLFAERNYEVICAHPVMFSGAVPLAYRDEYTQRRWVSLEKKGDYGPAEEIKQSSADLPDKLWLMQERSNKKAKWITKSMITARDLTGPMGAISVAVGSFYGHLSVEKGFRNIQARMHRGTVRFVELNVVPTGKVCDKIKLSVSKMDVDIDAK